MVVCIQIMVYRDIVVFLSSYFLCIGTISLGQVLSLLSQPHCQPVATCLFSLSLLNPENGGTGFL